MKPDITDDYRLYVNKRDNYINFSRKKLIDGHDRYTITDIKKERLSTLTIRIEDDPLSELSLNLLYALLKLTHINQVTLLINNVNTLSTTAIDLIVQILKRSKNICILINFYPALLDYTPINAALIELAESRTTALCFYYSSPTKNQLSLLLQLIQANTKISYHETPLKPSPLTDYSQCKQVTNLPTKAYDALKPCDNHSQWQKNLMPYIMLYHNELCIETLSIHNKSSRNFSHNTIKTIRDLNMLFEYYMKALDRVILCKALLSSTNTLMPTEIQTMICKTLLELYVHNKGALPKECIVQVEEVEEEENIRANQAPTAPIEQEKSNQSMLQRCIAYTCANISLRFLGAVHC